MSSLPLLLSRLNASNWLTMSRYLDRIHKGMDLACYRRRSKEKLARAPSEPGPPMAQVNNQRIGGKSDGSRVSIDGWLRSDERAPKDTDPGRGA